VIPVPQDEIERLRAAWRAGEAGRSSPPCPAVEAIWEAAAGEASPTRVEGIVDHTIACGACAEAWRVARAIVAERRADGEHVGATSESAIGWSRRWATLAAAAIIVVAAGVAYQQGWFVRDEPAVFRSGSDSTGVRSLVDDSPLPRGRFVLSWTPGPEGSRYNVTVTTEDLVPIASASALEVTEFIVPEAALALLPSGATIVWQVETVAADGRRVQSAAFLTRVE